MHLLFGSHSIRTPHLSVLDLEQFWMGDLLGSFPKSVRLRTKHAKKDSCWFVVSIENA